MNNTSQQRPILKTVFGQLTDLLPEEGTTLLMQHLEQHQLQVGNELWQEGDPGNSLAFILSGKLELLKETAFPGRPFVLGLFAAGSLVGEDSFLDNQPRQGTIRVLEACQLLILSRDKFEELNQQKPVIANLILKWLMNLLSARLRNTQGRLAAIF